MEGSSQAVWSQMRAREDLWKQSGEVQSDWPHKTEGETESHRICCTSDFSLLFSSLLLLFLCFLSFFSPAPFPQPLSFIFPTASSLILFTHRKIKTNYFIVSSGLADLLGVSVGDALRCHFELVQDIWLWEMPALSGHLWCPAHNSIDFSPVLHFSG